MPLCPRRARYTCALLLSILAYLLLAATAFALDRASVEADHRLTLDFVTPHTKWAKPYARGKIRVLFFTDGRGTNPRECVELMQRFSLDANAVFWTSLDDSPKTSWHGGAVGEERMRDLLRQHWDCFVFLGLPLTNVPPVQKQMILDAVQGGTGIVFSGPDGGEALLRKRTSIAAPFVSVGDRGSAWSIGRGREAFLPTRPDISYHEGWEVEYDYWQERLGRAVIWAAGKESALHLEIIPGKERLATVGAAFAANAPVGAAAAITGEGGFSPGNPASFHIKLSGKGTAEKLRMTLVLRCPGQAPVRLPERRVTPGTTAEIPVPSLPAGEWHLDAVVSGLAGVATWATVPFAVSHERSVSSVSLDPDWGERGGAITGKIILGGRPRPRELLRVMLLDRRRRILMKRDFTPSASSASFRFPIESWLPMLVTVEARLYAGGSELSRGYRYFHVTERKQGRFNFVMWGAPTGTLAPYAEESLADNGVTAQLDWRNPPDQLGAFDISWVPFTTHIAADKTPDGMMRRFCWNDERAVQRQIAALLDISRGSRERGSFVYSIGDENTTRNSCLSPYCADAYRTFLRQTYGSLAALNRSWETRFASWNDVGLSSLRDDEEQASLKSGNYPRWFDRQAYKSWNYIQFCLKHADAYRTMDPRARTGFDGAGGFATGDDIDLIVRSMGSWVPYPGITDEVIRSIAPRDFVRSNWIGGRDRTADPLLQKYWRLVTLGADSVWWWMWNYVGDHLRGFLGPDLAPSPAVRELLADTRIVREGLGDLLLHCDMQDDGIAVLYSYPSVFADKVAEGASFLGFEESHAALVRYLRASGLQFRYVTDRMLRQDEVDLSRYKILFLPRCEAIGDSEARAIRRFVEQGGTVVADIRPGLYDDHCKRRKSGVLDDLFGIKRSELGRVEPVRKATFGGSKIRVDSAVILRGSRAELTPDGIPVVVTRKGGKGRAILLNCDMQGLPTILSKGVGDQMLHGAEPVIRVVGADGTRGDDIEITRWRNGGSEIVSLFRKGSAGNKEVRVTFPGRKFVYDLRAGESYSGIGSFRATLRPDRASFFVLADKELPPAELRLAESEAHRGTVVRGLLSVPGLKGVQAIKIVVKRGGETLPWHDRVVVVGAEPVPVEFPIAYNDPAGAYRIVITEPVTGRQREYPLKVSGNVFTAGSGS